MKLANIGIGRKFVVLGVLGVAQLAVVAGVSLWALNASQAAAAKAALYAHKMVLAVQVSDNLSQLELIVTNFQNSRQIPQDLERFAVLRKQYMDDLDSLKGAATSDQDRQILARMDQVLADWRLVNNPVVAAARQGKRIDSANVRQDSIGRFALFQAAHSEYLQYRRQRMDQLEQDRKVLSSRLELALIGLSIFSLCTAQALGTVLGRSIAKPLAATVTRLNQIAEGDVSRDLPPEYLSRGDEIGALAKDMQAMSASIRAMIQDVSNGIRTLAASSADLSNSSTEMTAGSRGAADKAHSVAAATEQMSTNGEIAGNSEKARRITAEATVEAARITDRIAQLGEAARDIGKVTETITEISSQTNLLALNATIEAARAGSAGKGFAVVATEIKALAQQTAAATEDIRTRIGGVQSAASGSISEIEKVSGVIRDVSDIVASIAAAIEQQSTTTKDIARNIGEASRGVADATLRVAETSQASNEVARDIQSVDRAAREMAGGSEQVHTSARDISLVAEQLQTTVSRFHIASKLNKDAIRNAIAAHQAWTDRLRSLLEGSQLDIPVTTLEVDNKCVFGKWLYGAQLSEVDKGCAHYDTARQLHIQFHREAARIARLALSGEKVAAANAMDPGSEYFRIVTELAGALNEWIAAC